MNLSDDELMLFDKLYALLEPQVPVPDLVLHLVADVDTCMERIRKRQRNFEKSISRDYIRALVNRHRGNLSAAARDAEIDRKHLRELLRKHGMRDEE